MKLFGHLSRADIVILPAELSVDVSIVRAIKVLLKGLLKCSDYQDGT